MRRSLAAFAAAAAVAVEPADAPPVARAPRRAASSAMMFATERRAAVAANLNLTPADLAGTVGKRRLRQALRVLWPRATAAERAAAEEAAAADQRRYRAECDAFTAAGGVLPETLQKGRRRRAVIAGGSCADLDGAIPHRMWQSELGRLSGRLFAKGDVELSAVWHVAGHVPAESVKPGRTPFVVFDVGFFNDDHVTVATAQQLSFGRRGEPVPIKCGHQQLFEDAQTTGGFGSSVWYPASWVDRQASAAVPAVAVLPCGGAPVAVGFKGALYYNHDQVTVPGASAAA